MGDSASWCELPLVQRRGYRNTSIAYDKCTARIGIKGPVSLPSSCATDWAVALPLTVYLGCIQWQGCDALQVASYS